MILNRRLQYLIFLVFPICTLAQDGDSLFIETYPNGELFRKYMAIRTIVVDTLLTEDLETGELSIHISPHQRWCPHGLFEEYAPNGLLLLRGTLRYTYGASSRFGPWEFHASDGTIKEVVYDRRREYYFPEDPTCQE